jgi:SSS family transporter
MISKRILVPGAIASPQQFLLAYGPFFRKLIKFILLGKRDRIMHFSPLDIAILFAYLTGVTALGAWLGKKQTSTTDYFLGGRDLPWQAVCLSVVATETSTLTFISIPGLAYLTNLNFLQIATGYLFGRIVIAFVLLPRYYRGEIQTAYHLLGNRFGPRMRSFSSIVFQVTRLLADGVRLFAAAIPLHIITGWNYSSSIIVIALVTIIYTYIGGIRAVVWLDVLQWSVYISGALLALAVILGKLPQGWESVVAAAGPASKFDIIQLGFDRTFKEFFTLNYTLISGLLGGAFLSMASHGTDQLIVQRLLTCRDLRSSQKALIGSGFVVLIQFALFLILGLALFAYYQGAAMRSDEVLPRFIVEGLPKGISGIIIAGVFAAAMGNLSGSLNSLASSTMLDLYKPKWGKENSAKKDLLISRSFTFMWGIVFSISATMFTSTQNPVVELGLAIASFTYGGLLGTFFLGITNQRAKEDEGLLAMWSAIFFMIWIIGQKGAGVWIPALLALAAGVWLFLRLGSRSGRLFVVLWSGLMLLLIAQVASPHIAWPWYVLIGCTVGYSNGTLLSRVRSGLER